MLKIALILCLGLAPNVSASIATAVAGVRVAQTARGLLVENVTSWRERDPYSGVIQNSGITATDTSRMNAINRNSANSAHISRESHDAPIEAQLREARFWEEQTEQLAAANRLRALLRNLDPAQIPLELRHYFQTGQSAVSSNSNQETASSPLPSPNKFILSEKQIDSILAIQATLNLDPGRTGAEFTDFERGVGIALTQIAPNGMEEMMKVLGFVFSQERAQAILNAIIEDA